MKERMRKRVNRNASGMEKNDIRYNHIGNAVLKANGNSRDVIALKTSLHAKTPRKTPISPAERRKRKGRCTYS